jgi:hypothetical protein
MCIAAEVLESGAIQSLMPVELIEVMLCCSLGLYSIHCNEDILFESTPKISVKSDSMTTLSKNLPSQNLGHLNMPRCR